MIPLTVEGLNDDNHSFHRNASYFDRMFQLSQMDWEYAFAQLVYLLTQPSKVYQFVWHRKRPRIHHSRDDPAVLLVTCFFYLISGFAYGISLSHSVQNVLLTTILPLIYFTFSGLAISSICYWATKRYLRMHNGHRSQNIVEFFYCFDIHCSAAFPLFLLCFVIQYTILPYLLSASFFGCIISNCLYALGLLYYCYITSLGYTIFPLLTDTKFFLYPSLIVVLFMPIMTFFNVSMTRLCLIMFVNLI